MFGWLGGGNNEAPVYPELEAPQSVDGELLVFVQSFYYATLLLYFIYMTFHLRLQQTVNFARREGCCWKINYFYFARSIC